MEKPVLVVMAAGMGSRYGGLKQIDPVGANGQLIIDYSIYDARRAGFETVVFVIKRELAEQFRAAIGDRLSRVIEVKYAYQELEDLPAGYGVPEGRVKPWGTCHAVLAARKEVDGPFAVINSDDYYGPEAFREIYRYLEEHPDKPGCYEFAMVGYLLGNTVTEHGHVARGVCQEDEEHYLLRVTEHTHIEKDGADARSTVDGGETWTRLPVPVVFANEICKGLDDAMHDGTIRGVGPDGKAQVTVAYEDGKPVSAKNIVVSVQHDADKDLEELRREIISEVLYPILDRIDFPKDVDILINPSGRFVEGGPAADTGLTGRKLMVDTYGGLAAHGGGAFSGKDPTKVDRSAAYMARAIARNVVGA